jgi:predicted dinucleotide-binding enzyme
VVLAVKGEAAESVLELAGAEALAGKVVIDTTNPIAASPPVNGVLRYFTTLEDSLMERLQRRVPAARFVKAFSIVGNALMVDPKLPGGPPTMFICGNDDAAKRDVTGILERFGWLTDDLGSVEAAAGHRASVHPLVHPGLPGPRLDARAQDAALKPRRSLAGCRACWDTRPPRKSTSGPSSPAIPRWAGSENPEVYGLRARNHASLPAGARPTARLLRHKAYSGHETGTDKHVFLAAERRENPLSPRHGKARTRK